MGQGGSKTCPSCEQTLKASPGQCTVCQKTVCDSCSEKLKGKKVRICFVCKVAKDNREGNDN